MPVQDQATKAKFIKDESNFCITAQDVDSNCRFIIKAVLAGTNCCATYTRIKMIGPTGKEIFGSYFVQSGYEQYINLRDIL